MTLVNVTKRSATLFQLSLTFIFLLKLLRGQIYIVSNSAIVGESTKTSFCPGAKGDCYVYLCRKWDFRRYFLLSTIIIIDRFNMDWGLRQCEHFGNKGGQFFCDFMWVSFMDCPLEAIGTDFYQDPGWKMLQLS